MLDIDMLDCYVYAVFSIVMYVLHILYVWFWRLPSRGGRQNRQKIKKILMFIGYVYQLTDIHNLCSSVGRGMQVHICSLILGRGT
jgi:hypothetical protein